MSVRPTASHTRTPLGTGIIGAPARRPRPPPKRVTPKPGSARERCRQIQSRSPARPAGRECHRQAPPKSERSHSPQPENPGASGRSSSASHRSDAPPPAPLHGARMPPRQSPASARCSTGDAARDQPVPRRSPSHRLLHQCKHRCLHWSLPARSAQRSQDGPRRRVTLQPPPVRNRGRGVSALSLLRSSWPNIRFYRVETVSCPRDRLCIDLDPISTVKRNLAGVSDVYLLRSHKAGSCPNKGTEMPKETHTRAAEHHENAAKAHRTAAEHHGKGEHDKGHEESTKAHDHSTQAHRHSADAHGKSGEARTKK